MIDVRRDIRRCGVVAASHHRQQCGNVVVVERQRTRDQREQDYACEEREDDRAQEQETTLAHLYGLGRKGREARVFMAVLLCVLRLTN